MKHRYQIIYIDGDDDPCKWQVQERVYWFFWKDLFGRASSITTAANSISNVIMVREL